MSDLKLTAKANRPGFPGDPPIVEVEIGGEFSGLLRVATYEDADTVAALINNAEAMHSLLAELAGNWDGACGNPLPRPEDVFRFMGRVRKILVTELEAEAEDVS